jgi:hypothetical protein
MSGSDVRTTLMIETLRSSAHGSEQRKTIFAYARDQAFIDIVGHQGNDFQITDSFWKALNELTAQFDNPGRFVCLPGR